ncbi:MAG: DUF1549 and DUF1553 domain-containing protein [Pirellulales bacterium]
MISVIVIILGVIFAATVEVATAETGTPENGSPKNQPITGTDTTVPDQTIVTQKDSTHQPKHGLQPNQWYQQAQETMWAARPLEPVRLPEVAQENWVQSPIDRFVLAKLEQGGLTPTSAASRKTLIRRLYFDLLGLPPSYEEVQAFVLDDQPRALERLIDRLLGSPHYGERWGRHWLDVARYADNKGYLTGGKVRRYPYSYTYRDYVIRSFNQDLPFDRFLLEQIAADRLDLGKNSQPLAALGFLTVGRRFLNHQDTIDDRIDVVTRGLLGLTIGCARCHDHKYDPVRTNDYYALQGIFASCSEPAKLPQLAALEGPAAERFHHELKLRIERREQFLCERRDQIVEEVRTHASGYFYYVAKAHQVQENPPLTSPTGPLRKVPADRWKKRLTRTSSEFDPIFAPWYRLRHSEDDEFAIRLSALVAEWETELHPQNSQAAEVTPSGQINWGLVNVAVRKAITDHRKNGQPLASLLDLADIYGQLFEKVYQRSKAATPSDQPSTPWPPGQEQILSFILAENSPNSLTLAQSQASFLPADKAAFQPSRDAVDRWSIESPDAPPRAMVLQDHAKPTEPYIFLRGNPANRGPRVPRGLPALLTAEPVRATGTGSGRLELAQAIASRENPFTARVFVNRLWAWHFGQPLVSTPSDFGSRCHKPIHQQLLDYLAQTFIEHGWSVKRLHKQILLSATYQQASTPMMAKQWQANSKLDPENRLWWKANRRRLEWESLRDALLTVSGKLDSQVGGKPFDLKQHPGSARRTVYAFVDRQNTPAVMLTFDFADPNATCAKRHKTMVPQQGLFLLNSPFVLEQSCALSEQALADSGKEPAERITALYRLAYARKPTAEELKITTQYIADAKATAKHSPAEKSLKDSSEKSQTPWELLAQSLLAANEFIMID